MQPMPRRTVMLWISGLTWDVVDQIPEAAMLRAMGATITTLQPLPITGSQSQARQMISGQNPGRTGYFDIWTPRQYTVEPAPVAPGNGPISDDGRDSGTGRAWGGRGGVAGYTAVMPNALHEIIAAAGHPTTQVDLMLAEIPTYLTRPTTPDDCLLMHAVTSLAHEAGEGDTEVAALGRAIGAALTYTGRDGICLLVCDHHGAAVERYVNLNDVLRTLGVLEVSEDGSVFWEESLAYSVGHGQLWVNLEGREPGGIVAPHEYAQVCQTLVTSLSARLVNPQTGEPVIERIYRRDELYSGDYLFRAPDLIVVLRPGYAPSPRSVMLGFDGATVWSAPAGTWATAGLHPSTVAGLAVAVGMPFAAGQVIERASLLDIAPTVFHALGLPIPTSMDGRVITDLFTPAFLEQFPIQRAAEDSGLSAEDEAEIMSRLKSLGYLG